MKKAILIVFLITLSLSFCGCSLFPWKDFRPETIIPELLVSGDVRNSISIHTESLDKKKFGEDEGYALSDFLDKIVLPCEEYDVMILARDGKAIRIKGETAPQCYLVEKKSGVLELYSLVHYNFENSFLPLLGVSELVILANNDVVNGITLNGGNAAKISTSMQIEMLYKQLRTCESNGEHIMKEYAREMSRADKLLGNARSASIMLLDESIVNIDAGTLEILDWKGGSLVLRSSNLPIISVSLINAVD